MADYKDDSKTVTRVLSSTIHEPADTPDGRVKEGAWIRFLTFLHWYPKDMPSEEKKLILRLDLSILIFGCLSFFIKYLDQASLTNAYVSGMREDLNFKGNDLNYVTATFWASYCTFMIPACYFMTHYPANYVLPGLEVGWGICTFGLAWSQNLQNVYAMRFFTGIFECCSFTGTIYVIGSWYKPGEIGRRVSLFFIASPLGTMFAGYLQAAAYTNLHGVHGLAGWRWLFIVDAIITIPIATIGFFVFPDVPSRKKPRFLTTANHDLASKRLEGVTAPPQLKLSKSIFKRVLSRWHWYLLVLQWTLLDQNVAPGGQPFSLYLKAYPKIYSIVQVNTLPTITTAISIVAALTAGIFADKTGKFWLASSAATLPVIAGISLLVAWNVGEKGRLAGFFLTGFQGVMSPMTMSWATVIMAGDAEERAVVTASMNAIGQAIAAGSQVVQFPASRAPNFHAGSSSALATTVVQLVVIFLILFLWNRDKKKAIGSSADQGQERWSMRQIE
ncbi:putative allantoate permease [Aureobasidium pullulans EXF-150]|uniref:Putative allantoate permease n=1 Tax=Aureobasidium pullulans EXF-150 TaxID=1043002 RepID=A0A074XIJ6_AURPU|nr:putative allantoate permease [Aureobasidium pullulans EXF-150]KEQ85318.1 putative allantoate permease [Aureobasidium pullulans EXF-150]